MAIAIFSIFYLSLFFAGFFIFRLFIGRDVNLSWKTLFIGTNVGMSLCHGLVVSQIPLDLIFNILVLLALACLAFIFIKKTKCEFYLRARNRELLFLLVLVSPFFFFALAEPLTAWDARSIWFFRGKVLFFSNGLHRLPYNLVSLEFMAKSYPLFMPSLAATLMSHIHWWNEYFPKIVLWIWMGQVLWAFADLCRRPFVILIWVSIYFYFCGEYMWNGYMDAYVGFFSLFGLTYLYYFSQFGDELDLFAGISSLIVSAQIKNEGLALSFLILFIFSLWIYLRRIPLSIKWIRLGTFAALLGLPICIYWYEKKIWGISNYLQTGFSWARTFHRATNLDDLTTLFKGIFMPDRFLYTLGFLLFAIAYSLIIKKAFSWIRSQFSEINLIIIVAVAYIGVLLTVFLMTPLNLKDHLAEADRVSFPIYFFMIFVALWLLAPPRKEGSILKMNSEQKTSATSGFALKVFVKEII